MTGTQATDDYVLLNVLSGGLCTVQYNEHVAGNIGCIVLDFIVCDLSCY